ncbi:MAG: hypothetical protein ACO1RT_10615 [Planctomycetaceae bacterium]
MLVMLSKNLVLGLAVALTATTLGASVASAQSKIRSVEERRQGKGFWENNRASRNIQHARDYSRGIQRYTTQAPRIDPVITKAESEMLSHHVQGLQREMAAVRESNVSNPQVAQQVKSIETKVAQVASTQKMLHEECCKDSPDGKVCADMAAKITSTLDQIAKDHAKLLKTMGQEDAAVDHDHAKAAVQTPAKTAE